MSIMKLSACGFFYYPDFKKDYYYDLLPRTSVELKEDNPLYNLSNASAYSYEARKKFYANKSKVLNIAEWQSYFANKVTKKEIEFLFYSDKETLLKRFKKSKLKNNSAFKRYVSFLSKQEESVSLYPDEVNSNKVILAKEAESLCFKEEDAFFKLRYLFLAMRLNHYSEKYQETIKLYDKYASSLKLNSIVVEWIDALRAGALQHLGKDVESNLLYANILKNNKTNAYLGYYDFKIKNDKEWNALLSEAKDDTQRAEFYFLRALRWGGAELKEHREMASFAPYSVWFERLSYMIMQDLQKNLYDYELSKNKKDEYVQADYKNYLEKKKYFIETLSTVKEPSFFALYAELYLELIEDKTLDSSKVAKLKKLASKKEQVFADILLYLAELNKLTSVDKKKQDKIFVALQNILNKLSSSQRDSLLGYTAFSMTKLYPKASTDKLFSNLYATDVYGDLDILGNIDAIQAKNFEDYVEKKNRSFYEKEIFKTAMKSLHKGDIAKILAILNSKNGNFKEAQKYLNQVPNLNRTAPYNPFNVSLAGNNRIAKRNKRYSQRDFVKTMLKIEEALKKNPKSSMDHFLYATGLYNSTWFGNFPMSSYIYRNTTDIPTEQYADLLEKLQEIESEYTLALKYATKKEFKAKIAYQLLKVKSNQTLLNTLMKNNKMSFYEYHDENKLLKTESFKEAVGNYKINYSNTKYGKEIIKKCVTFSSFR